MGSLTYRAVKIANGQTTTAEMDMREHEIVGIQFGTVTGATISFLGRASNNVADGLTAVAVVDNAANVVSVTASDDKFVVFDEEPLKNLSAVPFLTIVSAGAEAAERTLWLALRRRI